MKRLGYRRNIRLFVDRLVPDSEQVQQNKKGVYHYVM